MKLLPLLALLGCSAASTAQNFRYLDINQVKAGIGSHGNLHANPAGGDPSYEVPKGGGVHANAFTNLWFGGLRNNQLYVSAQLNPQPGADFNSGPLTTTFPNLVTDSTKFLNVWKLNQSDINDFLVNYANGNVQNGTYTPAADLLSWPGNGDISKNQDIRLAPFVDVDADGVYSPVTAGDYPLIKGDQALFFVYNDVTKGAHASGGASFGLEIRGMAYGYGPCSVANSTPALNYTTFYDYTIINRSPNTFTDFSMGIHCEADLGQYNDDYIGCDVGDQYGYVYNGDPNDETAGGSKGYGSNPPAAAFVLLKTPEATSDGIDNDGDGLTDEAGEQVGMTGFSYFVNPMPGTLPAMQAPSSAADYYHYMNSTWKDGSPLTCNGSNGYGGGPASPYAYPANTYTNSACTTPWMETGAPGDRRYILNTRSNTLLPGEVIRLEFAHVTSFATSGNVLTKLDQDVNAVRSFYQSGAGSSCLATGLKEEDEKTAFEMYPVPSASVVHITLDEPRDAHIALYDLYGKHVMSQEITHEQHAELDLSGLAPGAYFVTVQSAGRQRTKKLMKL